MVRLEENKNYSKGLNKKNFNSYMVRLEVFLCNMMGMAFFNFNSYMVRLEARIEVVNGWHNVISIPIWCDWKPTPNHRRSKFHKFQFLYGANGCALYYM